MSTNPSTTTKLPKTSVATPTIAVRYRDGMVVTADDLDTAMRYPVSLLRTILRAHFGCGVVCGFELSRKQVGEEASSKICIGPGAAVDCNGHPLELCKSVELDFSLEPCTEFGADKAYIAVRRITSDELPADPCAPDTTDERFQCSRIRDHIEIKAFYESELTNEFCREQPNGGDSSSPTIEGLCHCLKQCSDCHCAAESWVMIGSIALYYDDTIGDPVTTGRRWAKPIHCLCDDVPDLDSLTERIRALEEKLADYKPRSGSSGV